MIFTYLNLGLYFVLENGSLGQARKSARETSKENDVSSTSSSRLKTSLFIFQPLKPSRKNTKGNRGI
jgi:hypothetical protein